MIEEILNHSPVDVRNNKKLNCKLKTQTIENDF